MEDHQTKWNSRLWHDKEPWSVINTMQIILKMGRDRRHQLTHDFPFLYKKKTWLQYGCATLDLRGAQNGHKWMPSGITKALLSCLKMVALTIFSPQNKIKTFPLNHSSRHSLLLNQNKPHLLSFCSSLFFQVASFSLPSWPKQKPTHSSLLHALL